MFHYQETRVEVDGGFTRQNLFFILGIQTLCQKEMMVEFWHQGVVVGDASFGTNDKKMIHTIWYVILACGLIHWYICSLIQLKHK
jgi:hypothetical protein